MLIQKFNSSEAIIESFVIALGKHRDFRQLSCYCIQSLSNVIVLSKQSEWRELIAKLVDLDTVNVIGDVMERHNTNYDVLAKSTEYLRHLCADQNTVEKVFYRLGKMTYLLDIFDQGGDDLILHDNAGGQILLLFDRISSYPNLLALMNTYKLVKYLINLMEMYWHLLDTESVHDMICTGLCILGKMSKLTYLKQMLISNGCVHTLMKVLSVSDLRNSKISYLNIVRMLLELTDNSMEAIALIKTEYNLEDLIKLLTNDRVHDNENILLQLGKELLERIFLQSNNNSVHTLSKILIDNDKDNMLQNLQLLLITVMCDKKELENLTQQEILRLIECFNDEEKTAKELIIIAKILRCISTFKRGAQILLSRNLSDFGKRLLSRSLPSATIVHVIDIICSVVFYAPAYHLPVAINQINSIIIESLIIHANNNAVITAALNLLSCIERLRPSQMDLVSSLYEDYPVVVLNTMKSWKGIEEIQRYGSFVLNKLLYFNRFFDSMRDEYIESLLQQVILNIKNMYTQKDGDYALLISSLELITLLANNHDMTQTEIEDIFSALASASSNVFLVSDLFSVSQKFIMNFSNSQFVGRTVEKLADFNNGLSDKNNVISHLKTLPLFITNQRDIDRILHCNGYSILENLYTNFEMENDFDFLLELIKCGQLIIENSPIARHNLNNNIIARFTYVVLSKVCQMNEEVTIQCLNLLRTSINFDHKLQVECNDISCITRLIEIHLRNDNIISITVDILIVLSIKGMNKEILQKRAFRQLLQWMKYTVFSPTLTKAVYLIKLIMNDKNIRPLVQDDDDFFFDNLIQIREKFIFEQDVVHNLDSLLQSVFSNVKSVRIIVMEGLKVLHSNNRNILTTELDQIVVQKTLLLLQTGVINYKEMKMSIPFKKLIQNIIYSEDERERKNTDNLIILCIKLCCKFEGGDNFVEPKIIMTWLLKKMKESPTFSLCLVLHTMLENELANIETLEALEEIIALLIVLLNSEFGSDIWFCKLILSCLRLFVEQSSDIAEIITQSNGLEQLCKLLSQCIENEWNDLSNHCYLLQQKSITVDSLNLLIIIAKQKGPLCIINDSILQLLDEFLALCLNNYNAALQLFSPLSKLSAFIGKTDKGIRKLESRSLQMLCKIFSNLIIRGQGYSAVENMSELTLIGAKKSKVTLAILTEFDLRKTFILLLRSVSIQQLNETLLNAVKKSIIILQQDDKPSQLDDLNMKLNEACKIAYKKGLSNKLISLLSKTHTLLSLKQKKNLRKADVLVLIRYLQRIVHCIKTKDNQGCIEYQSIQYLCLLLLAEALSLPGIDIKCPVVFVQHCVELGQSSNSLFRACGISALGSMSHLRGGILAVGTITVMNCIKSVIPLSFSKECYPSSDLIPQDTQSALKSLTKITSQLIIFDEKEGRNTVICILCHIPELLIDDVLSKICKKSIECTKFLASFLDSLLNIHQRSNSIISCIVTHLHNMECDHLSKVKVNVIMSACKEYPKTIMLLEKLSKAEDGPATLISTEGCIDMISRMVTESNNSAQSALSILMRCIRSRDSATALQQLKDTNILSIVLKLLGSSHVANPILATDALQILTHLLTCYGAAGLNLGYEYIDQVDAFSTQFESNKSIQTLASGIKTVIVKGISEEEVELNELADYEGINSDVHSINTIAKVVQKNLHSLHIVKKCLDKILVSLSHDIYAASKIPWLIEVIHTLLDYHSRDGYVVISILKILGILSISENNVNVMTQRNMIDSIGPAVMIHSKDASLVVAAMKFIANLGACKDNENMIKIRNWEHNCEQIVLTCMSNHSSNMHICSISLDALYNLLQPFYHSKKIENDRKRLMTVLKSTFTTLEACHYDLIIANSCFRVISLFTTSTSDSILLNIFVEIRGTEILVRLLSYNNRNEKFVECATLCLTNVLLLTTERNETTDQIYLNSSPSSCDLLNGYKLEEIVGVARAMEECLAGHLANKQICKQILSAFCLISAVDSLSSNQSQTIISPYAISLIRSAAELHMNDPVMVCCLLEVAGRFSRTGPGGTEYLILGLIPPLLLRVLDVYSQRTVLIVASLKVLWNMFVSSEEECQSALLSLMTEKGIGKSEDLLRKVLRSNKDEELQRIGSRLVEKIGLAHNKVEESCGED